MGEHMTSKVYSITCPVHRCNVQLRDELSSNMTYGRYPLL